eukprot:15440725-Alexandrium_andersonii.AAC.1
MRRGSGAEVIRRGRYKSLCVWTLVATCWTPWMRTSSLSGVPLVDAPCEVCVPATTRTARSCSA